MNISLICPVKFKSQSVKILTTLTFVPIHDDVIKWKHFPHYWPFVWEINRSPVDSPRRSQWHGALMLPFTCAWTNGWANKRNASDFRRHRAHSHCIVSGIHRSPLDSHPYPSQRASSACGIHFHVMTSLWLLVAVHICHCVGLSPSWVWRLGFG